jgi:hypothetical protein
MKRLPLLLATLGLGGCEGGLAWHFPVFHWAGGFVLGLAVAYGIFRYFQHHLRDARRDDRNVRQGDPTPKV